MKLRWLHGHRKEKRVYHVNILKKYYCPEVLAKVDVSEVEKEEDAWKPLWGDVSEDLYQTGDRRIHGLWSRSTKDSSRLGQTMQIFFNWLLGEYLLWSIRSILEIRHQSDRNPIEFPMREERLLKGSCMDEMLKAEGIRPSVSPWAAPIVLVPKKDGSTPFCVLVRDLEQSPGFVTILVAWHSMIIVECTPAWWH